MRRCEDDVRRDERAGAEGGPLVRVDLGLQHADALELVRRVVGALEDGTGRLDQGE
ncbi:MAG TPA: hypothetical protein VE623_13010 [Acidimicrobiales bacterium]|nr:hypothetical protein [Acidimicrobiales bacterium]